MNKNEFVVVTEGVSRLAQLVERKTLNLVVVGSSPTVGVLQREWSSPVMTPASHAGNHEFESRLAYIFFVFVGSAHFLFVVVHV